MEAMEEEEGGRGGDVLPESFVSAVLALTTPRDVCSSSLVSTTFQLAATADHVWDRLLPPDCADILSRAVSPVEFTSKKELYFPLCGSILIDEGTKKQMITAMEGGRGGDVLPESLVSEVLALTTPRDVCSSSLVSTTFQLAAAADRVWDRLLPPDCADILSRAVSPVEFTSKKELYFRLCDSILIDEGTKSFSLVRTTGKTCIMLSPRQLSMIWGNSTEYWRHVSHPDSRFGEVAELLQVCWLHVYAGIETTGLSAETDYAAYLIFKLKESSKGFSYPTQETTVKVGDHISKHNVCLQLEELERMEEVPLTPCARDDGWMEIEMGDFYNALGNTAVVHVDFMQVKVRNWKSGLIIQGVELRPKY